MVAGVIAQTPLLPVPGVLIGVGAAGIKLSDRHDLALLQLAPGSRCAAVFTRNAFCAAPVQLAKKHLAAGPVRHLLVNSGNANAGTGPAGLEDAAATCAAVAASAGGEARAVLPFSTGVIGQRLPVDKIRRALPQAVASLSPTGWENAARAIMTTDTVPKGISRTCTIAGRTITFTGIAKGAGMIRPDMATLLSFIATDATVEPSFLQAALESVMAQSFNCITVDGDTSTNDACVLMATGQVGGASISAATKEAAIFQEALTAVCRYLAEAVVRDGEGASKFIRILVEQGASDEECRRVAYAVAESPLVKTACYASDANWGRILAAVGRAGVPDLKIAGVNIVLNGVAIVTAGSVAPGYTEAAGQQAMQAADIGIRIQLGRGASQAEVLTCDLSLDYVRINAEYRT
ncbi:MAG TPA: bifunctional glutamate N-acetyltransferase/amino-acid acetyltransferase ArgJ [Gammaproteobacteria bacterium]|nr:bifunctional glutamate N-acetyltransferase/amino-acid acetyltransferase ArgJ [Gammaproteobacteria bacterium]